MAIKKNEIYSSLYASCDKLRGGMDPSQYKNYILTLLFVKYVTDKFKGEMYAEIEIPEGGSFDDIVALRGKKNIGEGIDIVIAKLAEANELQGIIDNAHFNDEKLLGSGQTMVDKLTDIVAIFMRPEFDFKNNKASGDDILGDAYEYLMRKFAVESGKSKGQFYTPAEVSRILAKVVGIDEITPRSEDYTVYDPACGSGSLLIRAVDEAPFEISLYGQELDSTTAGLAKMNLVLHNKAAGEIKGGKSTFSEPQYFEEGSGDETLKRFDFVVMNPPFSTKNWTDGYKDFGRTDGIGTLPPEKNGDYAWFLHVIKSLKRNGKAAIIMPLGVLFRGNAEETIRTDIIDRGYIKAIISLPSNLFYGTGIAAAVIVIDKEDADERAGIFMIDASHDFIKDGNKNRLREEDIYKIVTTYKQQIVDNPHYARFVPNDEIKIQNKYNLNITRYIDSGVAEDIQDLSGHIHGGIPSRDVAGLDKYWDIFPELKRTLFALIRDGYYSLNVEIDEIRNVIYNDEKFSSYAEKLECAYDEWKKCIEEKLFNITSHTDIKELIMDLSRLLVEKFDDLILIDKYDVYEVLLSYWNETMADDVYVVRYDGYEAGRETADIIEVSKGKDGKEKEKIKGWDGKLIPKTIIESVFFESEQIAIEDLQKKLDENQSLLDEWIEEQSSEDGLLSFSDETDEDGEEKTVKVTSKFIAEKMSEIKSHCTSETLDELKKFFEVFIEVGMKKKEAIDYINQHPLCSCAINDKGGVNKTSINAAIKKAIEEAPVRDFDVEEYDQFVKAYEWTSIIESNAKIIKSKQAELDIAVREKYAELTIEEIKELLIRRKWFEALWKGIDALYASTAHLLSTRVAELSKRYESTLPEISNEVNEYEAKVRTHLERMGYIW